MDTEHSPMQSPLIDDAYWRAVLDAVPANIFVTDADARILDVNRAARTLIGAQHIDSVNTLCGHLLGCVHAHEAAGGCGTAAACPDCVIRQSIREAGTGHATAKRLAHMRMHNNGDTRDVCFVINATAFTYRDRPLILLVLDDVTELIELRRLLPMCASCHKVRNDANYWQAVDDYLLKYTGLHFSHGLCPDCLRQLYPDQAEDVLRETAAART